MITEKEYMTRIPEAKERADELARKIRDTLAQEELPRGVIVK